LRSLPPFRRPWRTSTDDDDDDGDVLMLQASSESSSVISFLRAARAGSDQQIVECLDAGVDINVCNSVSRDARIVYFNKRYGDAISLVLAQAD